MSRYQRLLFYLTPPDQCSYLLEREAVNLFADPRIRMSTSLYGRLIDHGFRRSGNHVYRPQCPNCKACVPTRIPVARFKPKRSQRRNLQLNSDLEIKLLAPRYRQEHFELYRAYQNTRHTGGGMDNPDPMDYRNFLICDWADSLFIEFRLHEQLLAVAVSDVLPRGLSAVYTFFDTRVSRRGLGTYAILWQIEEARRRRLNHVYLGYWIAEHEKMSYKTRFRPIEVFTHGEWATLAEPAPEIS